MTSILICISVKRIIFFDIYLCHLFRNTFFNVMQNNKNSINGYTQVYVKYFKVQNTLSDGCKRVSQKKNIF